jgi:enamine deaminase RidA (YjgF/YER057c/UK114 family)
LDNLDEVPVSFVLLIASKLSMCSKADEFVSGLVLINQGRNSVKQHRNPPTIHHPLAAYSHQIEINEEGRWLVLSGQIGMDREGNISTDPLEQLQVAWRNLEWNLAAANMQVSDLVKITFFFVSEIDAEVRKDFLESKLGGHTPCMTLIYVAGLAHPAYGIEIDAWACARRVT